MTHECELLSIDRKPGSRAVSKKLRVRDVMIAPIAPLHPSLSLIAAARLMRTHSVDALPVADDNALIGMVTAGDITLRAVADGANIATATVSQFMSHRIVTCMAHQSVDDAEALMSKHGIRHLPVLNSKRQPIGLLLRENLGGKKRKNILRRVVFHKRLCGGAGRVRKVPIAAIYISCSGDSKSALEVAKERFARSQGVSVWTDRADGYEVVEAPK